MIQHEPLTEIARQIQRETQEHQEGQRIMMKKRHDGYKKVVTFKIGDFAPVAIPRGDRTSLDPKRMHVKIIGVPKDDVYILQCQYGVIDRKIGISSLNILDDDIVRRIRENLDNAPTEEISLHKAARIISPSDRVAINCSCRKGCTTNKCTCHKNDTKCGQNCHGDDSDCGNMTEHIEDRVYRSLVVDSNSEPELTPPPPRKRAATLSSPKQPRKHAKTAPPPPPLTDGLLSAPSAADSLPARRRKFTALGREYRQQRQEAGRRRRGKEKE